MPTAYIATNKKSDTKWNEYESMLGEPNTPSEYSLTAEDEKYLLNNGLFLKARVHRNMRKIRRHNAASNTFNHDNSRHNFHSNRLKPA
jgi:hypothetical protein